jgi:hypothetical protein
MTLLLSTLGIAVFFGTVKASTDVSGIPKPSVPEFTVKYVDNSYDVPPTYGIDPYTGKSVITQAGYHVENKSIEVIIQNQPFTSYRDENNSLVGLYYYILAKGKFQDWYNGTPDPEGYIYRSDGEYTVVTYGLGGNNGSETYHRLLGDVSADGRVDFKVQALIGYNTRISRGLYASQFGEGYYYVFTVVETSDWSDVKTVTVSASQTPTPSPSTASTPTPGEETRQTEQEIIIGVAIVVAVIGSGLGLLIYLIKRK